MIIIIFIAIYLLSVISLKYSYKLCGSQYYGLWLDSMCKIGVIELIPVLNTLAAVTHWIWLLDQIMKGAKRNK